MLATYADYLRTLGAPLPQGQPLPDRLRVASEGRLATYFAPFDYVNPKARVVLVGITPGLQQAVNALNAARSALQRGASVTDAAREAKTTGSFSGPMRRNLVDMLNHVGVARWLGLGSCDALFTDSANFVHFTSMLRYPMFVDGKDYSGNPAPLSTPFLQRQLEQVLLAELRQLPDAVFVPLGPKVAEVIAWAASKSAVNPSRVLDGMPHPSGANAERIAYFLGRKPKDQLSTKTNAATLDASREKLMARVRGLG